jgi:hypothetical protein
MPQYSLTHSRRGRRTGRRLREKLRLARVNKERALQLAEKAELAAREAAYEAAFDEAIMRGDAEGLRTQQAAEAARRAAGRMGMRQIEEQMQARSSLAEGRLPACPVGTAGGNSALLRGTESRGKSVAGQHRPSRPLAELYCSRCPTAHPPPHAHRRAQERLQLRAEAEAEYHRDREMVDAVVARIQQVAQRRRGARMVLSLGCVHARIPIIKRELVARLPAGRGTFAGARRRQAAGRSGKLTSRQGPGGEGRPGLVKPESRKRVPHLRAQEDALEAAERLRKREETRAFIADHLAKREAAVSAARAAAAREDARIREHWERVADREGREAARQQERRNAAARIYDRLRLEAEAKQRAKAGRGARGRAVVGAGAGAWCKGALEARGKGGRRPWSGPPAGDDWFV